MTNVVIDTATRNCKGDIDLTIRRAFLTANLLTADARQAERAVTEAIDSWNPGEETQAALFRCVLEAAVERPARYESSSSDKPERARRFLPAELRAVLSLPTHLRHCFVLRTVAGLSRQICDRLLHLTISEVDQYACAALECLMAGKLYGHGSEIVELVETNLLR